jgi:Zn-dependent protease
MPAKRQGAIHLFRIAGIDVFLHWSWFVIALIEVEYLRGRYTSIAWSVLEYLALFVIVLLHEFGHALACRQVGGRADTILLWPLGGVAYVDPPPRPGAMLWSLAAGPLVNVALLPVIGGAYLLAGANGSSSPSTDFNIWLYSVLWIDLGLLIFNILPIYPLDGGQILRSLLWFVFGRGRSLQIATVIGFIGAAAFVCFAVSQLFTASFEGTWLLVISAYMLMNCWSGWKMARILIRQEKLPRREGFACPNCKAKPPLGPHWHCAQCHKTFDTFESGAVCPWCNSQFPNTVCMECHQARPMRDWMVTSTYQGGQSGGALPDRRPAGS